MMKKFTFKIFVLAIFVTIATNAYSTKTAGTLTFNVTTGGSVCLPCNDNGQPEDGHVLAIWIQNSANEFVKSKIRYAEERAYDLEQWNAISAGNVVDAVTGATKFAHGAESITWDGTDVNGNLVDDGEYTVFVEMSWNSDGDKTVTSTTFTKGASAVDQTPTATTYFTNMTLNWAPSSVGIAKNTMNMNVSVFPNPATSELNIDFGTTKSNCTIQLVNTIGSIVYTENRENASGKMKLDLSNFAKGVYFVRLSDNDHVYSEKVIVQ